MNKDYTPEQAERLLKAIFAKPDPNELATFAIMQKSVWRRNLITAPTVARKWMTTLWRCRMNANEIVRELRESCTCNEFAPPMVTNRELTEAADLIESLQARADQAALNYQQKCRDVAELEAQLAASKRRERAAVEDIKRVPQVWPCYACKHTGQMSDRCHYDDRDCFEWRGPQEAGKGEAE